MTSDRLKPRAAPQSPCVSPTSECPLLRGYLRGPRCLREGLLRGDEFTAANVAEGSGHAGRFPRFIAEKQTVKLSFAEAAGRD